MNKTQNQINEIAQFIRSLYPEEGYVPLHRPLFVGNEKKYLLETIDSSFVSGSGEFIKKFEAEVAKRSGHKYGVATTNATAALHLALVGLGVGPEDEVICPALTFVATANSISYCGADPIFVDSSRETLGISPESLEKFLREETTKNSDDSPVHKKTGKKIKVIIPTHVFGHGEKIDEIVQIAHHFGIKVVEDASEALGSRYKNKPLGSFGDIGFFSFNGNKILTSGGGGCVVTSSQELAKTLKHLSTGAKIPHEWEFDHDQIGHNYRMPNLNAALGLAQLENLDKFVDNKREVASFYKKFFQDREEQFFSEGESCHSNYWLNAILVKDQKERDFYLSSLKEEGIQARPVWKLIPDLPMYQNAFTTDLENARELREQMINLPSSVQHIENFLE